jgi:transposase InsO family protein
LPDVVFSSDNATLGVIVQRVMTDNGSCYRSGKFAKACRRLRLKHIRTKP